LRCEVLAHSIDDKEKNRWIIMEYFPLGSLCDFIHKNDFLYDWIHLLDIAEVLFILLISILTVLQDIVDGMAYLHQQSVR